MTFFKSRSASNFTIKIRGLCLEMITWKLGKKTRKTHPARKSSRKRGEKTVGRRLSRQLCNKATRMKGSNFPDRQIHVKVNQHECQDSKIKEPREGKAKGLWGPGWKSGSLPFPAAHWGFCSRLIHIPSPAFQPLSSHLCRALSPFSGLSTSSREGAKTNYLCSICLQLRNQVLEFYSTVESKIQILYSAPGHLTRGSGATNQPARPPPSLSGCSWGQGIFSHEFALDNDRSFNPYFTCIAVCGVSLSGEGAKSLENSVFNVTWELGRGFACLRSILLKC